VLGSIIGFERERLLWAAGIRTHMLVSVGSCLLMIVSAFGFSQALTMAHVVLDPSRIAAQVVSGIGFIGAGSILLRGQVVRGLTTAASIWAVAAIGLAAGGGLFYAAIISTVIILAILAGVAARGSLSRPCAELHLRGDGRQGRAGPRQSQEALGVRANQIKRALMQEGPEGLLKLDVQLSRVSRSEISQAAARLRREPGVHEVEVAGRRRRGRSAGIRTD